MKVGAEGRSQNSKFLQHFAEPSSQWQPQLVSCPDLGQAYSGSMLCLPGEKAAKVCCRTGSSPQGELSQITIMSRALESTFRSLSCQTFSIEVEDTQKTIQLLGAQLNENLTKCTIFTSGPPRSRSFRRHPLCQFLPSPPG